VACYHWVVELSDVNIIVIKVVCREFGTANCRPASVILWTGIL